MKNQTKKISYQVYQHIATNLFISKLEGENWSTWNVWKDSELMEEYAIGFHTKADAVSYCNNLTQTESKPKLIMIERSKTYDYYFENQFSKGTGTIAKKDFDTMVKAYQEYGYLVIIKKIK